MLRSLGLVGMLVVGTACGSGIAMPLAESDHANTPAAPVPGQTEAQQPAPAPRASTTSRSVIHFPYVAQPEWLPTQTNYWEGRGGASIDYIVMHYTDISYARAPSGRSTSVPLM